MKIYSSEVIHTIKEEVTKFISPFLREAVWNMADSMWNRLQEIRLSPQRPVIVFDSENSYFLSFDGSISDSPEQGIICGKMHIEQTMQLITQNSIYAVNDKLKNGYITLPMGHRVGIVGTAVLKNDEVSHIKDISCINFRIKREIKGAANKVIKHLVKNGVIQNTIIIAPPQCGKTTLLRDICRLISSGNKYFNGFKVGLIDERSEIAAMYDGVPQNDIGPRTAVLDFCPKDKGMTMMLRSMSPDVIITDELGLKSDIIALRQVLNCGVKIITTVHGFDICDIRDKEIFKDIFDEFELVIVLSRKNGTGTIENIYRRDKHGAKNYWVFDNNSVYHSTWTYKIT